MTFRIPLHRVAVPVALALVLALFGWASAAQAAPATYAGSSVEGDRVFFTTSEKILTGADRDDETDVYQRRGNVTSLVSFGPFGGNRPFKARYGGASDDGTHVYFETEERLVQSDTDTTWDVYERSAGTTVLVSRGELGNADLPAEFRASSSDGSRVIFATEEALLSSDTDNASDLYVRANGATALLSPGGTGGGDTVGGVSADGTRIFFLTTDKLVQADTDSVLDVYESVNLGAPTLVSSGPAQGAQSAEKDVVFGTISKDGSHAFFETSESLVEGDGDLTADVYERSGGVTRLVSVSSTDENSASDATFEGASADGTHVYFLTKDQLSPGDGDAQADLYVRGPQGTVLVSTSETPVVDVPITDFEGASKNGSHAFFTTIEQLTADDQDSGEDIYVRTGNVTSLVSAGVSDEDAFFDAHSEDGTRVLFSTEEPLDPDADDDSASDVYERSGETTTLVSVGQPDTVIERDAGFAGATPDASTVYIGTGEHLTSNDFDLTGDEDVFSRSAGLTRLETAGGQVGPVVDIPTEIGSSPGSPSSDETPMITGRAPDNSLVRLYLRADCADEYPLGAGSAQVFKTSGIEITVKPDFKTKIYATATDANGNTSGCSESFTYEEDSTAPTPPTVTGSNPASPANDSTPHIFGVGDANSWIRVYRTPDCTGDVAAEGIESVYRAPGFEVTVTDNTTAQFSATATDEAGNISGCSATPYTYVEDSSAVAKPVLSLSEVSSPANQNNIVLKGTAPAAADVRIYESDACAQGTLVKTVTAEVLGGPGVPVFVEDDTTNTFTAVAETKARNVSPCSEPLVFQEDSTAPAVPKLSLGSGARTSDNRVTVRGEAGPGALVYLFRGSDCKGRPVSGGTGLQLGSGITLAIAEENVEVEIRAVARDAALNFSACSEPLSYVEDSLRPETRITFSPAFKTRDRSPTFRFLDETEDPSARFQCRVDRKQWRGCSSPKTFKGLRPGRHTIRVRSFDAAGNRESTPVVRKFRVVR